MLCFYYWVITNSLSPREEQEHREKPPVWVREVGVRDIILDRVARETSIRR